MLIQLLPISIAGAGASRSRVVESGLVGKEVVQTVEQPSGEDDADGEEERLVGDGGFVGGIWIVGHVRIVCVHCRI